MVFDSATISAILIVIVALFFVVASVRNAEKNSERNMRKVMRQTMMMQRNKTAWELCKKVHAQYPDACPGLDFTFREDEKGVFLDEWRLPQPRPDVQRVDSNKFPD